MKKLIAAAIAIMSLNSFANTVYLDSANVDLGSNTATLVKTQTSPSVVNLKVTVPTTVERCEEADMRVRTRLVTSGARCGYDTISYRCGGVYTGPRYNPRGPRRRGPRGRVSIPAGRRYNPARANICYRTVARTCSVSERYCVNPQYVTVDKVKNFELTFAKFYNNEATINFSLDQNQNLTLEMADISPSCVKKKVYKSGGVVTGARLKLKRSCR